MQPSQEAVICASNVVRRAQIPDHYSDIVNDLYTDITPIINSIFFHQVHFKCATKSLGKTLKNIVLIRPEGCDAKM